MGGVVAGAVFSGETVLSACEVVVDCVSVGCTADWQPVNKMKKAKSRQIERFIQIPPVFTIIHMQGKFGKIKKHGSGQNTQFVYNIPVTRGGISVILQHGNWRGVIEPDCGCNITALSCNGEEILRTPASRDELFERPCLYGVPLLLPANRTKDGRFFFGGEEHLLVVNEPARNNHIHGLLKDAPFTVLSMTSNSQTAQLENTGELYPFPFVIKITDTLSDSGLTRRLILKNTGKVPMPYTLAFHTAFAEPDSFCVDLQACYAVDERFIPTGEILPLTENQALYKHGFSPDGSKISGFYTADGHTARIGKFHMTVSEQFDHWVLFNGNGNEGYLCIEPQCGAVNGLNNGKHRVLQPGDEEEFYLHIG